MSRVSFPVCLSTVLVVLLGLSMATVPARAQERHNILVIFGDDVGMWNISAYHRGMMGGDPPPVTVPLPMLGQTPSEPAPVAYTLGAWLARRNNLYSNGGGSYGVRGLDTPRQTPGSRGDTRRGVSGLKLQITVPIWNRSPLSTLIVVLRAAVDNILDIHRE